MYVLEDKLQNENRNMLSHNTIYSEINPGDRDEHVTLSRGEVRRKLINGLSRKIQLL